MSKNAFWVTVIFAAAIAGALLGPALAQSLSPGAMMIFSVIALVAIVALIVWSLSSNKSGKKAGTAALADARAMRAPEGTARIYITRRGRSEERRVGKECVRTWRYRWSRTH